jgi:hypothetical protein
MSVRLMCAPTRAWAKSGFFSKISKERPQECHKTKKAV